MSRIIEVGCCAACPYIEVGRPEDSPPIDYWDYCELTNKRIINTDKIAQFCPLKKDDEENEE